jgi:monoamine oxidase
MSSTRHHNTGERGSVIVIGAGVAGLAAAHYLKRHSFRVTVLEARERIGGRICTETHWGVPIDLGASWVHGTRNNPIAKLARTYGLPTAKTDYDGLPLVYMVNQNHVRQLSSRKVRLLSKLEQRLAHTCRGRRAKSVNCSLSRTARWRAEPETSN